MLHLVIIHRATVIKMNRLKLIIIITTSIALILNLSFISKTDLVNGINEESLISIENMEESTNLVIIISQNSTGIGMDSGIEFEISLLNNMSYLMQDITAEVSTSANNIEILPQKRFDFNTLEGGSTTTFKVNLKATSPDNVKPVDVALLIDASGSMGEEINSVQDELTRLINVLTNEIPDLRIGVIVYGSSTYSEYPTLSSENYISFSKDFDRITSFINDLSAGGGIEPWGDALYLVNSWDWRETAQKLAIIVGDEDCDPGKVIGEEDPSASWYNGTSLLNIVTELKNKGVTINSVLCEGPDANVEHQFSWISTYTLGEMVYLPELERADDPVNLPKLIEEWTLELSREYSSYLDVDVSWNEDENFFKNSERAHYWMDFSAPGIVYFDKILPREDNLYDVQIFAEVSDHSEISNVVLCHNGAGNWVSQVMNFNNETNLYDTVITGLAFETNLSFYIEASDEFKNLGVTSDFWLIVSLQTRELGEIVKLPVTSEESIVSLIEPEKNQELYLIIYGKSIIEDITVNLMENENQTIILPSSDITTNCNGSDSYRRILQYSVEEAQLKINLTLPYLESYSLLEYVWLSPIVVEGPEYDNNMDNKIRTHLYEWTLTEGYLAIDYTPSSDLVVFGEVYHSNWTYIGNFSVLSACKLPNGTYFIIIRATLREGSYRVIIDDNPPNISDWYYAYGSASPGFSLISVLAIFSLMGKLMQKKRRKKNLFES